MTRDELTKALEEYPEKLSEALLRQFQTYVKLEEARTEEREPHYLQNDDNFDFHAERAKLAHVIPAAGRPG